MQDTGSPVDALQQYDERTSGCEHVMALIKEDHFSVYH